MAEQSGDETLPPSDKNQPAGSFDATPGRSSSGQPEHVPRESMVGGVVSSVKYLQDAHGDVGVIKLRKADRVTMILLMVALAMIVATFFLHDQKNLITLIADGLFAVVLFAFMAMRFGVLRSLSARQAVLTWQLIVGSFLLGLYAALNTKLIALMYEGTLFR